jgi:hypothetical protein
VPVCRVAGGHSPQRQQRDTDAHICIHSSGLLSGLEPSRMVIPRRLQTHKGCGKGKDHSPRPLSQSGTASLLPCKVFPYNFFLKLDPVPVTCCSHGSPRTPPYSRDTELSMANFANKGTESEREVRCLAQLTWLFTLVLHLHASGARHWVFIQLTLLRCSD